MLFAVTYVVIAGASFLLLNAALHRSAKPHFGLAYLRASLGVSVCLVAMDLLIFLVFGFWWMPLALAVGLGFVWPGVMLAIT